MLLNLQCVLFLLAGYDTIATTLTNTAFLLARNPDVQEKLYQQLTRKLKKYVIVVHPIKIAVYSIISFVG